MADLPLKIPFHQQPAGKGRKNFPTCLLVGRKIRFSYPVPRILRARVNFPTRLGKKYWCTCTCTIDIQVNCPPLKDPLQYFKNQIFWESLQFFPFYNIWVANLQFSKISLQFV